MHNIYINNTLYILTTATGEYRVLVGKSEGKKPIGRNRRRWKDNIKMELQEVVCGVMDWITSWLRIGTNGGHL
jgi:hypothetical protein